MPTMEELSLIAAIADDLPAGVWVAKVPDGAFVYANRAFAEIMGMGPVQEVSVGAYAEPYGIYGRDGKLYPEDRMPFVQALRARTTVVVDDLVIHRRDGKRVFVRATAKPMHDANGEMTHIAIAFFDITREVEVGRQAAEVEGRLRRVVADAPIILYTFDREGRITMMQGRGLERIGRQPSYFLGESVYALAPDVPAIAECSRRALAGETVSYLVERVGTVFETRLAPLHDDTGAIVGAIGVSTDVTDRHLAEAQLARAERLASVGMLAAGVAHEVNNPLTFVIGNLERLSADVARLGPATERSVATALETMVREAREGAERVRSIVRDLSAFSRVQDRPPSAVDVRAVVDAAVNIARNELRHRARLVIELGDVPVVWADEGRVGQLVLNLLINAAQAIPDGAAERHTIRVVTGTDASGSATIEVSDTGVGMERDVVVKIFDPFFTTKPVGVGTGIGLSISHAIATDLGGRIEVESRPGAGSTFRVVLPAATPRAAAPPPPTSAVTPSTRRGRILIVDDEVLLLKFLAPLLSAEHDVTCEERATAALARIRAGERYEVILCDLMMPDMTGMDLHDALRSLAPDQARRMVFLTGGAFTEPARAFLAQIPDRTLEKPFDARTLLETVRRLVG